jgi:hypothetical protein
MADSTHVPLLTPLRPIPPLDHENPPPDHHQQRSPAQSPPKEPQGESESDEEGVAPEGSRGHLIDRFV